MGLPFLILNLVPGGLLLTYQKFSEKVDRLSIMNFFDFRVVDSLGNELVMREAGVIWVGSPHEGDASIRPG